MKKILFALLSLPVLLCLSAGVRGAVPEGLPLILTIKSNVYQYQGPDNQFTLYFGATADETEYYIVGPGFEGPFLVDQYYIGEDETGAGTVVASAITCSLASYDDTIRIYGDASKLDYLDMHGAYLTSVELNGDFVNLTVIDISHNEISSIDLSGCANLVSIDILDNAFKEPSAMKIGTVHPNLQLLTIGINEVCDPELDLRNFPSLQYFSAYNNTGLTHVDPSKCPEMVSMQLDATNISAIDVSNNPKLRVLNLSQTKVNNVDLSANSALTGFYFSHDGSFNSDDKFKVKSVDLSHNSNLEILDLGGNLLEKIDLTSNTKLKNLNVARNLLTEINLESCSGLYRVDLSRNYFDFATLPLPRQEWDYYYYQNPIPMDFKYRAGDVIDLSAKVIREPYMNASGTLVTPLTYATVFAVPRADTEYELDKSLYDYTDGKIMFKEALADSVYVAFHCTAFDEWDLRTTTFMVKSEQDFDEPSKVFSITPAASMGGNLFSFSMGVVATGNATLPERASLTLLADGVKQVLEDVVLTDGNLSDISFTVPSSPCKVDICLPDGLAVNSLIIDGMPLESVDLSPSDLLASLSIINSGLTAIDLAYNRELRSLDLSGNAFTDISLAGVRGDYEKWLLTDVDLSNNRLSELTVTYYEGIQSLNLSENDFSAFDCKYYTGIVSLNLASNRLSGELDLSENPLLKALDLKGNDISSLILADPISLEYADFSDNAFTLATLPVLSGENVVYRYAPQAVMEILPMASAIDLSEQNITSGAKGGTVYVWKYSENCNEVPRTAYTAEDGVFEFGDELIGQTIFCEMSNPLFPDFAQLPLTTSDLMVSNLPDALVASFTTAKDGKAKIGFMFNRSGDNVVYVDWKGDGKELEPYVYSSGSPIYRDGTTYAGANVKVYTFGSADVVSGFFMDATPLLDFDGTPMTKLEALDIHNAGLKDGCIKLPASRLLYELVLDGNAFSSEPFEGYPNVTSLNLAANNYESIDLSVFPGIMFAQLSRNRLSSVKFGSNKDLLQLDLQANRLTEINLTDLPNLQELLLSDNELASIDLSPVKEKLRTLYISGNYFTFANLPLAKDMGEDFFAYDYSNQKPMEVNVVDGDKIDLSNQAIVDGTPTVYRWFAGDSQDDVWYDYYEEAFVGEELTGSQDSEEPDFIVENGVTTFLRPQSSKVICAMTNAQLPSLILYTRPASVGLAAAESVFASQDGMFTVYTVSGMKVASASSYREAVSLLSPGLYVINGYKVLVR